jgi:hypothetical protein
MFSVRIFEIDSDNNSRYLGTFETDDEASVYAWRDATMNLFPTLAILIDPLP